MTRKFSSALVPALLLAATSLAPAAMAGDATAPASPGSATEARKVIVLKERIDGGPGQHTVMVTSRSVDGQEPSLQVMVSPLGGGEAEALDLESLALGETRTFTTKSGRDVEVSRTDAGLRLTVDGKEILLPSLANLAVMSADGATGATWISEDGDETRLEKNVFVFSGEPHGVMAMNHAGLSMANLDNLKALEGASPEVRERVIAALHELLQQHHASVPGAHGFAFITKTEDGAAAPAAPTEQRVRVRRAEAPAPR